VRNSASGSVLESMPGCVLENILGVYSGVPCGLTLGAYSQAGWECVIELNWECT